MICLLPGWKILLYERWGLLLKRIWVWAKCNSREWKFMHVLLFWKRVLLLCPVLHIPLMYQIPHPPQNLFTVVQMIVNALVLVSFLNVQDCGVSHCWGPTFKCRWGSQFIVFDILLNWMIFSALALPYRPVLSTLLPFIGIGLVRESSIEWVSFNAVGEVPAVLLRSFGQFYNMFLSLISREGRIYWWLWSCLLLDYCSY